MICGLRIFEYEHIIDYSVVKKHDESNISLLCHRHHTEKTSGRLDTKLYSERNNNPFNKQILSESSIISADFPSKNSVHTVGIESFSFSFEGSSTNCEILEGHFAPLVNIDFEKVLLVRRQDQLMLLTLTVIDKDRKLLLEIIDGEIRVQSEVFDYELVRDTVKIRSAVGKIDFEFRLTGNGIHISRGSFHGQFGSKLEFSKKGAFATIDGGSVELPVVSGRNKSIIMLPNGIEISDVSIGGNIVSENYLSALYLNIQHIDKTKDQDYYYFMQHQYLNCLTEVYRANNDRVLLARALPIMREFLEFCKDTGRFIEYAQNVRILGRELWRLGRENNLDQIIESVKLLEEAITLPFIKESKSELARAKSNLGESLLALNKFTNDAALLVLARKYLVEALNFYDQLPLVASEDSDALRLRSMISDIDNYLMRNP